MNSVQAKHLRERLARARTRLLEAFYMNTPKPAAVVEAEALVEAFQHAERQRKGDVYRQIESAIMDVESRCIFGGDASTVIDAIKSLDDWRPTV